MQRAGRLPLDVFRSREPVKEARQRTRGAGVEHRRVEAREGLVPGGLGVRVRPTSDIRGSRRTAVAQHLAGQRRTAFARARSPAVRTTEASRRLKKHASFRRNEGCCRRQPHNQEEAGSEDLAAYGFVDSSFAALRRPAASCGQPCGLTTGLQPRPQAPQAPTTLESFIMRRQQCFSWTT